MEDEYAEQINDQDNAIDRANAFNKQMPYNSPLDRYGSQIVTLTDPSDDLYQFELFLRCLKEDADGNLIKVGGDLWRPLINDEGVNSLLMMVKPILNRSTALSNLDENEIGIIIEHFGFDLADLLTFNKMKFELLDVNRRAIAGAAIRFCYIFLKRPFQEGDKKFFKGITQEIRTINEMKKPSGSFSMNPFKGFKK